jgi:hypothetical protein
MIIQREEKDGIVKGFYKSSNVGLSEYNKATKELTVTFNNGGVYAYHEVADKDYFRFELADSQGKVLNTTIKKYAFTKLDKIEESDVTKQLKAATKDEKQAFRVKIIELMSQIRVDYFQSGEKGLNEKLLKELDVTREYLAKL